MYLMYLTRVSKRLPGWSGRGTIKGSFVYSSNLTLFSTLLDYEDGILISEILEGVFSQVGPFAEEMDAKEIGIDK